MKKLLIAMAIAALTVPVFAQAPATTPETPKKSEAKKKKAPKAKKQSKSKKTPKDTAAPAK